MITLSPRLIRYRDAPMYCGMSEKLFNEKIRPLISIEIKDGPKVIIFDKVDLDKAIDHYKIDKGQPFKNKKYKKELNLCPKDRQACNTIKKRRNGVSTKKSEGNGSENVYDLELSKKQK